MSSSPGEGDTHVAYHWIQGVEPLSLYEPGGYHPIVIGNVLHDRYHIVDKLGSGGHSTIWLAYDGLRNVLVAVKVSIANSSSTRRESSILRELSRTPSRRLSADSELQGHTLIPTVLDEFELHGPNGTHPCYTIAPAQGDLKTASFSRLFPIQVARALSAGLALAVAQVHAHGYVHGDIRLRNILVKLPPEFNTLSTAQLHGKFGEPETRAIARLDGKPLTENVPRQAVVPLYLGKTAQDFTLTDARNLLLVDFGEAFSPANEIRLPNACHSPIATRPPEALFEPEKPLSYPSDIWSLALAIWDILGMKFLFSESEPEYMVAAEQIDVLGVDSFPTEWWEHWENSSKYFTKQSDRYVPANGRDVWPSLENAFEEFCQRYRKKWKVVGEFETAEIKSFLDLMRQMLKFRPKERLTVEQVLQSEWMVKWALPELQRTQQST